MKSNWYVECGASLPNGRFMRNVIVKENEVNKFRFSHNNQGVFATIYKYDSPQQSEALLLSDFYLDLDDDKALELVIEDAIVALHYIYRNYGIRPEMTEIYFSGKKGIHIIVPKEAFGIVPVKDLNRVFRLMAEDIKSVTKNQTIDLKIYDSKRLFRLPNSIHPSTGLYKIPITYDELKSATPETLQTLAKEPRVIGKTVAKLVPMAQLSYQSYQQKILLKQSKPYVGPTKPLTFTPPCVKSLIEEAVPQGQRNNSAAALASFFRQQGINKEECRHRIGQWNEQRCDPQIPDYELDTTVESVYKGEYKMGCTWLGSVSSCDKTACQLYKRRIR